MKRYLLAEDTIDQTDLKELSDWLLTNPWLTQGPLVKEFEGAWAKWMGRRHALFVNSGSSANLLMYAAVNESRRLTNRKVVVPAVSWATTVAPAIQLGFEPIMCDAESETFGLDPERLEEILKAHNPSTVILVHVLGVPNKMNEILELKAKYGFTLLEDSCAATGSRYDGQLVGTSSEMSSFSFFFGHHMSTIEGGMVTTDDDEIYDLLLQLRSHGWAKDLEPGKEEALASEAGALEFNRPFTFYRPGFNVRSTDLNAKIGLIQMRKLDRVVQRRSENDARYRERFGESDVFSIQKNNNASICSISFSALARDISHRDRIGKLLTENQIETRPLGGGNMSRQPFWSRDYGSQSFPVADRIHDTSFQIPNHPGLSLTNIDHICDIVILGS